MGKSVREAAMDMLARREHSRHELQQKLRARDHAAEEIEAALTRLAEDGLLNDVRFVEMFVSARLRRGSGPLKVAAELRDKGVSDALLDEYLDERDAAWFAMAVEVRRKKFGTAVPIDFRDKARQARFLQQRGFTTEQVRRALADQELD